MFTEKELRIEELQEELELWEQDLAEHEAGIPECTRNIERIKKRLSRLTAVSGNETGDSEKETTMKRLRVQIGCTDFRQVDITVPDNATEDEICDQALAKAEKEFGKYEEMEVVDCEETRS